MKLIEYADSELMWMQLADHITSRLNQALMTQGRASLAVPGGTTPGPLFDVLSGVDLDWSKIDVLLTDERWVPETDPRSNAKLIRERLMVGRAAAARLLPYYAGGDEPAMELGDACREIAAFRPLTVVLLGMGEDMHTASLFPGGDNLAAALAPEAPELVPMHAEGIPEPRVSLSADTINGAMDKNLVILGAAKRAALERAAEIGDPMQAPVAAVLDGLTVHWAENA